MVIMNKEICDVLRLILLINQMDAPSITLFAHDADTLLENQNSEQKLDQSKKEVIEV